METVWVRTASWDKTSVLLIDVKTDQILCVLYPLDKEANADGARRALTSADNGPADEPTEIAPYLRELMTEYAATGLPAAYIPFDQTTPDQGEETDA